MVQQLGVWLALSVQRRWIWGGLLSELCAYVCVKGGCDTEAFAINQTIVWVPRNMRCLLKFLLARPPERSRFISSNSSGLKLQPQAAEGRRTLSDIPGAREQGNGLALRELRELRTQSLHAYGGKA
eukprot:897335-Pelagomonas_calceolata.AAC.5